jgi:thioredoxin-like negative regulator of GroEL
MRSLALVRSSVVTFGASFGVALAIMASVASCRRTEPPMRTAEPTAAATSAQAEPPACAAAEASGPLRWFHDDYPAALACARAKKVPLVVDLWAPWCHTCLSMKATVFQDPAMAEMSGRFVFVALDTDREVNAKVVGKLAPGAWPTFYVVASDETVQSRFVGAASVAQFVDFLSHGARGATATTAAGSADDLLRQGERAAAIKDHAAALAAYKAALAAAPKDWSRRPDALVSLASAYRRANDQEGCFALGEAALQETGSSASATDFLVVTLECAGSFAEAQGPRVKAFKEKAMARLRALLEEPTAQLSVDDRSDAMANLRALQEELGDKDAARATAEKQRALLDDAAAKAPTPFAAMTYNWPRAEVYVYLGKGLELVADLQKSAAALPAEYDPPYRLAWVLFKSGKLDEAVEWNAKAEKLIYGPRKARVLSLRADLAAARKDAAGERAARADLVAMYEALPAEQAAPEALAKAKEALAALDAAATAKPPAGKADDKAGGKVDPAPSAKGTEAAPAPGKIVAPGGGKKTDAKATAGKLQPLPH